MGRNIAVAQTHSIMRRIMGRVHAMMKMRGNHNSFLSTILTICVPAPPHAQAPTCVSRHPQRRKRTAGTRTTVVLGLRRHALQHHDARVHLVHGQHRPVKRGAARSGAARRRRPGGECGPAAPGCCVCTRRALCKHAHDGHYNNVERYVVKDLLGLGGSQPAPVDTRVRTAAFTRARWPPRTASHTCAERTICQAAARNPPRQRAGP